MRGCYLSLFSITLVGGCLVYDPAPMPPASDPTAGDEIVAGDRPAGDPNAGDPTAGDEDPGDTNAGDPASAGDPTAGDPSAGDPSAGDPGGGEPDLGAATQLRLTGPTLIAADTCSGIYRLDTLDGVGQPAPVGQDIEVTFSDAQSYGLHQRCGAITDTATLAAGTWRLSFFVTAPAPSFLVQGSVPGLPPASLLVSVSGVAGQPLAAYDAGSIDGTPNVGWSNDDAVPMWQSTMSDLPLTASTAPLFASSGAISHPAVRFDGTDDGYEAAPLADLIHDIRDTTGGITVFMVIDPADGRDQVFFSLYGHSPADEELIISMTGGELSINIGGDVIADVLILQPAVHSFVIDNDGRTMRWKENALQRLFSMALQNMPQYSALTHVGVGQGWVDPGGGGWQASQFFVGDLYYLSVYDRILQFDEELEVRSSLRTRFGL